MPALTLKNLSVSSMGESRAKSVSLIFSGNAFCVCGKKYAGKTPLCLALAGYGDVQGQILLNGEDITSLSPEQRNVGVLFGKPALFSGTVLKNVCYGLALRKDPAAENKGIEAATRLGISHLLKEKARKIKRIAAQKIALARLIARTPKAIFADFPVRGESEEELAFLEECIAVCKERDILFVLFTESPLHARLFSRLAVLEGGALTFFGSREQLKKRPPTRLAAAFLGEPYSEIYGERISGIFTVGDAPLFPLKGEGPALALAFEDFAVIAEEGIPCRVDYVEQAEGEGYRYYLDFSLKDEETEGKITRFTLLSARPPREGEQRVFLSVDKEKVFLFRK